MQQNQIHATLVMVSFFASLAVQASPNDRVTPLHEAVQAQNLDSVKALLEYHISVDPHNIWGYTPLHYAVIQKNYAMVELLLNHGAQVNATTKADITPLHFAVYHDLKDIAELLLDRGAQVNAQDNVGCTPLDRLDTRVFRHDDIKQFWLRHDIKQLLLGYGAVVARDEKQKKPKHRLTMLKRFFGLRPPPSDSSGFALVRYNSDGSLDTSFGSGR